MRRPLEAAALVAALAMPARAAAGELPAAVRTAYQIGTREVALQTDPAQIPLRGSDWYGNTACPYFRAMVNGRGPFTFLLDTGASYTFVSAKLVKAARLAVVSREAGHHVIVKIDNLQLGPVVIRNDFAVVEDGLEEDAIFGFNSFGGDYLTLDMRDRVLTVGTKATRLSPRARWMPYVLRHRVPVIGLALGATVLPALIDTGDDAYAWEATSAELKGLLFDRTPLPSARVYNPVTGFTRTMMTSVDGVLRLGRFSSPRPAVAINEALPIGDIGIDVVKQFVVEFDRVRHRVGFDPLFAGTEFAVPGEFTLGFSISYRKPGRHVGDVLPGMAPERAGMKEGDVIVRLDGRPAQAVTKAEWRRLVRHAGEVHVEWKHGSTVRSTVFRVVELK
jgi:hypothetical protein